MAWFEDNYCDAWEPNDLHLSEGKSWYINTHRIPTLPWSFDLIKGKDGCVTIGYKNHKWKGVLFTELTDSYLINLLKWALKNKNCAFAYEMLICNAIIPELKRRNINYEI